MYITNYPVFFQCYFRSGTEILMTVCSFWTFFPGIISREGTSYFNEWGVHFQRGFIFRWRGHPIGVASAWMSGGGGKKIHGVGRTLSCLSSLGQTLVCVVTGLKRSMNYNMLRKIYKKRILTLQEKALLHR